MQIEIKPITVPGKMFGESPPSYNQPERLWRHILFKSLVQYHKNLFLNFFILSEVSFFLVKFNFTQFTNLQLPKFWTTLPPLKNFSFKNNHREERIRMASSGPLTYVFHLRYLVS